MGENEMFRQFCERRFDSIDRALTDLNDRLFMDNGSCLQSKVNDNRRLIKIITGVFSMLGAAVLTFIGWVIKQHYVE